jgi:hypothetical protein
MQAALTLPTACRLAHRRPPSRSRGSPARRRVPLSAGLCILSTAVVTMAGYSEASTVPDSQPPVDPLPGA